MNILVKHYAGSIAYGTNIASSDTDIRGIYCADIENFTNPFRAPEIEYVMPEEEDGKLYELSFYISKYVKCNPTIIETLWVDESDIIEADPLYWRLRNYRELLLTRSVADSYIGYAKQQLGRIKGHNKWINNPMPKEAPDVIDFLEPVFFTKSAINGKKDFNIRNYEGTHTLVKCSGQIYGLVEVPSDKKFDFNAAADGNSSKYPGPVILLKFNRDEYFRSKGQHKQYWTWKKERNQARSELEEAHGYDTKHAMHLMRILRMGKEILSGKGVIIKRPDADNLLDIRNGKFSLDEILAEAEELQADIKELEKNPIFDKNPRVDPLKVLDEIRNDIWYGPELSDNNSRGEVVTAEKWQSMLDSGIVLPEDTAAFWGPSETMHSRKWSAFSIKPKFAKHVFYCTI